MKPLRRLLAVSALVTLATTSFTACGGADDTTPSAEAPAESNPEDVMAFAAAKIDETSGVRLSLSTKDTRDSGDFLASASGVVTNAPAFDGVASGRFLNSPQSDVGIRSVDNTFYVDVPVLGWQVFDPTTLCAPDPATLLDPDLGIGHVLSTAEGLTEGEQGRSEADNKVVVTPYTGTVAGEAIKNILPCAPGDEFDLTLTITANGYLRGADITGLFFKGNKRITYSIDISDYDVEQEITAP